ncbi:MAG: DUF4834 family protein [Prevotella sp.]|nr:DUF4834 family protein [Prevotella sp.]
MIKFIFSLIGILVLGALFLILYFVWMFWKMRQKMNELSKRAAEQRRQRERAARGDNVSMDEKAAQKQQQKIFADDEGEYVEFEEEP